MQEDASRFIQRQSPSRKWVPSVAALPALSECKLVTISGNVHLILLARFFAVFLLLNGLKTCKCSILRLTSARDILQLGMVPKTVLMT